MDDTTKKLDKLLKKRKARCKIQQIWDDWASTEKVFIDNNSYKKILDKMEKHAKEMNI